MKMQDFWLIVTYRVKRVHNSPIYSGHPVYYGHRPTSQNFQLPSIFCKLDLYKVITLYTTVTLPFAKGDHSGPSRTLRSSDKELLIQPCWHLKTHGEQAFSFIGPKLWNTLPLSIKRCKSAEPLSPLLRRTFLEITLNCKNHWLLRFFRLFYVT